MPVIKNIILILKNDQSTGEIKVIGGDDLSTLTGKVSQMKHTLFHKIYMNVLFKKRTSRECCVQNDFKKWLFFLFSCLMEECLDCGGMSELIPH